MPETEDIRKVLDRLANWDQPINFHQPVEMTPDITAYLNYYGFNIDNIDFHFGKIDIDETKIMVQIFSPKQNKGTVFLLHGYLDHVGYLNHIIQYLNDHHYNVISYDLQGHGLSEGEKASVDAFSDYVLTLEKLMRKTKKEMPLPMYIIGHSTGGAIAINYALKHNDHHFEKLVLAAPLIRSNYWYLSKLGFYLMKPFPFIDDIRRNFRENSSNEKYLTFSKKDPLQSKTIPLEWLGALINWNEKIKTYPPTDIQTCIIQGDKDETVEWKYNLEFVKKKFHHLEVCHIENGRHQLFNEKKSIREKVFTNITKFFNN
ncbi:alpha-beta hydrolase superfamily lysophospholipase [Scopulibacillus darangshiensis]|uniref:Alpha-beta hydrolase superfamily lysophospholipase n=1 Tax=Scopulibacillus darangshiensis TaxID=442528 RepID=A0A4R2P4D1_9BACL|nr:alpha/beta hydrolase [Scopulibacillus darangshiensis]TCP28914.1 alpha-beta hydrolase superfamily lysophospholipase [Scopulibacillus darangshiensis]